MQLPKRRVCLPKQHEGKCSVSVSLHNTSKSLRVLHLQHLTLQYKRKGKGTIHPRTRHEIPEGRQRCGCTLFLTLVLEVDGWSASRPGRFTPGKDPVPIVQEAAIWRGCRKFSPPPLRRDSVTGPSSPQRVAVPTGATRPTTFEPNPEK